MKRREHLRRHFLGYLVFALKHYFFNPILPQLNIQFTSCHMYIAIDLSVKQGPDFVVGSLTYFFVQTSYLSQGNKVTKVK